MDVRERVLAGLARQLGHPDGWRGRVIGRLLNRGNRSVVSAAVEHCGVGTGGRAADLGFGGGIGLRILLDRMGPSGRVDGVDVSQTMLDAASRRFSAEISARRLVLHAGTMVSLPLETDELDAAITVNTIYFVDDLPLAFAELARVLRPGGRAVVGLGDPQEMARMPFTSHGFRLREAAEVVALLGAAGFDVEQVRVGDLRGAFHLLVGTRRDSAA